MVVKSGFALPMNSDSQAFGRAVVSTGIVFGVFATFVATSSNACAQIVSGGSSPTIVHVDAGYSTGSGLPPPDYDHGSTKTSTSNTGPSVGIGGVTQDTNTGPLLSSVDYFTTDHNTVVFYGIAYDLDLLEKDFEGIDVHFLIITDYETKYLGAVTTGYGGMYFFEIPNPMIHCVIRVIASDEFSALSNSLDCEFNLPIGKPQFDK